MNIAILDGYKIVNVISVDDRENPADFGGVLLPEGLWIGDEIPHEPDLTSQIQTAMMAFAATSTNIPYSYALDMPDLFPLWEDLLAAGNKLAKGTILKDGDQLYRVAQEDVLPQEHQPPHGEGMTAVYVPINRSNAGTLDDPIPAVRGMDYIVGKYYLDPEDSKVYLCQRLGEEDGNVITLQYLPHELIDQYFVLA